MNKEFILILICYFGLAKGRTIRIIDEQGNRNEKSGGEFGNDNVLEMDGRQLRLIEGDILIDDYIASDLHHIQSRSVARNRNALWKTRVIPYVIDKSLDKEAIIHIREVIQFFLKEPTICLKFVERTNENAYIVFKKTHGCSSYVGMSGGPQIVSVSQGCTKFGTIAHEIMHALGFWHHQSRNDRDQYVKIMDENINEDRKGNFKKRPLSTAEVFSFYDYGSVMHYSSKAFSSNGKDTIVTIPKTVSIGQRTRPSKGDLRAIAYLYSCNTADGIWSEWSLCQYCSQQRTRVCFGPSQTACGGSSGIQYHSQLCPCDVQSIWGHWQSWSICSKPCEEGQRYRNRPCENGLPGSKGCQDNDVEYEICNADNGCERWDDWAEWTSCSATCGNGRVSRERTCIGGLEGAGNCKGDAEEIATCQSDIPCEFWDGWSEWSSCSVTCGEGTQMKRRECVDGEQGSIGCKGEAMHMKKCTNNVLCGHWSSWSDWSGCSVTCGDGARVMNRICKFGEIGKGGCIGESVIRSSCTADDPCDKWNEWSYWSSCSRTCGHGKKSRTRMCEHGKAGEGNCQGRKIDQERCLDKKSCDYWSEWNEWTDCSASCGNGLITRSRDCIKSDNEVDSNGCIGQTDENKECNGNILCESS